MSMRPMRPSARRSRRRCAASRCRRASPSCPSSSNATTGAEKQDGTGSEEIMSNTRYTEQHEWIAVDGNNGTVGIQAFAKEQHVDLDRKSVVRGKGGSVRVD